MANAEMPTIEEAQLAVFDNVYKQLFFQKMASAGFAPQTEDQAAQLLDIAAELRHVAVAEQYKQAGDARDFLGGALHSLQAYTGTAPVEKTASYREVARNLASHPDYFNAMLALKADEANRTFGGE